MPIVTTTLVLRLKQKCSQTMKNTSVLDRYKFIGIGTGMEIIKVIGTGIDTGIDIWMIYRYKYRYGRMCRCENRSKCRYRFICQELGIGIVIYKMDEKCEIIRIIRSKAIVL